MVIVNFGGWIKEEIESRQCGVYIPVDQPENFIIKVLPFVHDRTLLQQFQQNARNLAEEKYSRKMLSDKFVKIIEDAATR